jgi:transcription antitermination factor NusG
MLTERLGCVLEGNLPAYCTATKDLRWYAIQIRCRFEKKAATELQKKGIEVFLPIVNELHHWCDRRKILECPVFPGYAFVRIEYSPETRMSVLRAAGVLSIVSSQHVGVPIPGEEIESVRVLVEEKVRFEPYPFLRTGQRVRIRGGVLDRLEGILSGRRGNLKLIVSVETIERSLAICLDGYDVEPI